MAAGNGAAIAWVLLGFGVLLTLAMAAFFYFVLRRKDE